MLSDVIRPKRRVRSRQSRHEDEDVSVSERLWGDMLSDDSLSDDIPLPKYGYVYSRFNRRLLYWFFLKIHLDCIVMTQGVL